jgi:hypothetical protein
MIILPLKTSKCQGTAVSYFFHSVPGRFLLPYIPTIVSVLELTTRLVVREASQLTGAIMRNTLRALTLICPTEYKVRYLLESIEMMFKPIYFQPVFFCLNKVLFLVKCDGL